MPNSPFSFQVSLLHSNWDQTEDNALTADFRNFSFILKIYTFLAMLTGVID